jgi:hypothetical protein
MAGKLVRCKLGTFIVQLFKLNYIRISVENKNVDIIKKSTMF